MRQPSMTARLRHIFKPRRQIPSRSDNRGPQTEKTGSLNVITIQVTTLIHPHIARENKPQSPHLKCVRDDAGKLAGVSAACVLSANMKNTREWNDVTQENARTAIDTGNDKVCGRFRCRAAASIVEAWLDCFVAATVPSTPCSMPLIWLQELAA